MKPRVTLLPWSGGLDSTYLLFWLLRHTDDQVVAHHVDLVNAEGRHQVESERCAQIFAWCHNYLRGFRLTTSRIERLGLRFMGFDVITAAAEAGIAARDFAEETGRRPDRWTLGTSADDTLNPARRALACNVLAANCYPDPPPAFFLPPRISKARQIRAMPRALANLTWSCRRPVAGDGVWRPCGACPSCLERASAEAAASSL